MVSSDLHPPNPAAALRGRDSHLLQAWFLSGGNFILMAQREQVHVEELIAWSQRPSVKDAIAAIDALADLSANFRKYQSNLLAIEKLEHVLKNSTDLIELRRTATTLLRGPVTPRGTPTLRVGSTKPDADPSTPRPPKQPLPEGGEGEGSPRDRELAAMPITAAPPPGGTASERAC